MEAAELGVTVISVVLTVPLPKMQAEKGKAAKV